MNLEKRLEELSKCIIITDDRVGLKASKEEVNSLQADLNQVKNEINAIKASLKASQDAEKSANEALEEYESLVDIDTDAYVLKTPNGHVIVGENFATIVTRSDTKTVHF